MTSIRLKLYGMIPKVGDLVLERSEPKKINSEQISVEDAINQRRDKKVSAIILTTENLDQYSIHDVVLPLPGTSVIYPLNELGAAYVAFMAKDGISMDSQFKTHRDLSLPGDYRKITAVPSNMTWKSVKYGCDDDLIQCDLQKMNDELVEPKGALNGFIVEFSLLSSQYATMALREVFECATPARSLYAERSSNTLEDDTTTSTKRKASELPEDNFVR